MKKILDRLLQPSSLAGVSVLSLIVAAFLTFGADPKVVGAVAAGTEAGATTLSEGPQDLFGYISAAIAAITAAFAILRDDKSDPPA